MHLYDSMFYENYKKSGKEVLVLSNYNDEHTKKLFSNFYHGNKFQKAFHFALALTKTFLFSLCHKNDTFIYQSFGLRKIDQLFIHATQSKNKYVLVHDIFDITDSENEEVNKKKIEFYNKNIKQIICHSKRTEGDLRSFGYEGKIVYFPHFRFNYDEQMNNYDDGNVGGDVKQAVDRNKYNLLFFGQVRESKGIDVVLDSLEHLSGIDNINIIIAGMDKYNLVEKENIKLLRKVLRYINNDEMMYLYSHCDFVLLPYKEIYQSGVMESMIYFKKPGIMSDVEYFANIGKEYPSFGLVYSPNNAVSLAKEIRCISEGKYDNYNFYTEKDVLRYDDSHDVTKVISKEF